MSPTILLALALAISLAGNAWLFHSRDQALAAEARTEQLERDTRAAAVACSASVDELAKKGDARQRRIEAALAGIAPTAAAWQAEAIAALQARPADPADLCGSLLKFWQGEIRRARGAHGSGSAAASADVSRAGAPQTAQQPPGAAR